MTWFDGIEVGNSFRKLRLLTTKICNQTKSLSRGILFFRHASVELRFQNRVRDLPLFWEIRAPHASDCAISHSPRPRFDLSSISQANYTKQDPPPSTAAAAE